MNAQQVIEQLRNYPPDATVLVYLTTGDGAHAVLQSTLVVDASRRNGATGAIAEHRAAIVTEKITGPIRPSKAVG
jgi:hypothetical protein